MHYTISLRDYDITVAEVHHNLPPSALYEHAIRYEKDASIADSGALVAYSGVKTGRSPKDKRIKLAHTRAIIDAIHSGALADAKKQRDPVFGFDVVTTCPEVPSQILWPRDTWADKSAYDAAAKKLAKLFVDNFKKYEAGASAEVRAAAPAG